MAVDTWLSVHFNCESLTKLYPELVIIPHRVRYY